MTQSVYCSSSATEEFASPYVHYVGFHLTMMDQNWSY